MNSETQDTLDKILSDDIIDVTYARFCEVFADVVAEAPMIESASIQEKISCAAKRIELLHKAKVISYSLTQTIMHQMASADSEAKLTDLGIF